MSKSQILICGDIPLSYDADSIYFTSDGTGFGDSIISFMLTNLHETQGFAYPLAKLVPLTPLPAGMTLSDYNMPWNVFASAWNSGEKRPVTIFYNVTESIPIDYTVVFEIWVSNLSPLLVDSCYFPIPFTINLNPLQTSTADLITKTNAQIFPNPAHQNVQIQFDVPIQNPLQLEIKNYLGISVLNDEIQNGLLSKSINIAELTAGIYFITITENHVIKSLNKLIVK